MEQFNKNRVKLWRWLQKDPRCKWREEEKGKFLSDDLQVLYLYPTAGPLKPNIRYWEDILENHITFFMPESEDELFRHLNIEAWKRTKRGIP